MTAAAVLGGGLVAVAPAAPAVAEVKYAKDPGPAEALDIYRARILAKQQDRPVEVLGLRDESSRTVVKPDGLLSTTMAAAPMHVRQADGSWKPVDTNLRVGADGRVRAAMVPFDVSLSGGGSGPAVDVAPGVGKRAKWALGNLPTPLITGDTARYAEVRPGVDLLAKVVATGFELSYVLTKRPQPGTKLQFPLQLTGLTLGEDAQGEPQLVAGGKPVVRGAGAWMWDANTDPGKAQDADRVKDVDQAVSGSTITLSPSDAFLQDPQTAYPVTVDPPYGLTFHYGTYVYEGASTTNYDTSSWFRSGLATTGATRQQTLLRFQIPATMSNTKIYDATLNLWNSGTASCTPSAQVIKLINSTWAPSTVTWGTRPSYTATNYDSTSFAAGLTACPAAWQTMHMGDVVHQWANAGVTNNGFAVIAANEADSNSNKVYLNENSGKTPTIVVDYNTIPGMTAARSMSPAAKWAANGEDFTSSTTPTLRGAAVDPDGEQNYMKVEVNNATTNQPVWSGNGSYVAAGSSSPVTIPAGKLQDGQRYWWQAKNNDGRDDSTNWSNQLFFTVDTTAPAAPTVVSSNYPQNVTTNISNPGQFTFSSPSSSDVVSYDYQFDTSGPWTNVAAPYANSTGGSTTAATTISNLPPGWNTLRVVAIDRAGNRSGETSYAFGTATASVYPAEGATSQRFVKIWGETGGTSTQVRFRWRTPDVVAWSDIQTGDALTAAVFTTDKTPIASWPLDTTVSDGVRRSPDLLVDLRKLLVNTSGAPVDGTVLIEAQFSTAGATLVPSSNSSLLTLDQNGFGAGYATEDVGPGTVSLATGNLAVSSTDASLDSYGSDLTVSRTFNSRQPAATGLFGPGWTSSLSVDAAGADYTGLTDIGGSVTVTGSDASILVFTKSSGIYIGQNDAAGMTLTASSTQAGSGPQSYALLDEDGNTTTFKATTSWLQVASRTTPHSYPVDSVDQPGTSQTTTYSYSSPYGVLVPARLMAPSPANITCPTGTALLTTSDVGCRAIYLSYASVASKTVLTQVTARMVEYNASNLPVVTRVELACYHYDPVGGGLDKAWDPRVGSAANTCGGTAGNNNNQPATGDLVTTYSYDGAGRLWTLTPPGLAAWTLGYDGSGQLATACRSYINACAGDPYGSSCETFTVVYDVPFGNDASAAAGEHPDLSVATARTWAQADTAATAVAVYGPGDMVSSSDLRDGTVHALDAASLEVNTASYSGSGQAGWKIETTEYDPQGNVTRTLDAANRDRALRRADAPLTTAPLPADTADAARRLDTTNLYAINPNDNSASSPTSTQRDLTDTFGPMHMTTIPDGTTVFARGHTHTDYDTGADPGRTTVSPVSLHLPVSTWTESSYLTGVYTGTASTGQQPDRRTTSYGYTLGGAADLTGWRFRTALTTTTTPGSNASPITTTTKLDPITGLVTQSRMPSDPVGTGAGTTVTTYYTTGTRNDVNCVNSSWYMQICKTAPAAQPGVTGLPQLPVTTSSYDWALRPKTVTETVLDASSGSHSRTSTTVYQNGGLSPRTATTSLTSTDGTSLPTVTYSYHPATGLPSSTSATGQGNPLTTEYDDFGRAISYIDADGALTTTSYDGKGRPSSVSEIHNSVTLRTTTLSYDGATPSGGSERRGLLTSSSTTGLGGAFTGSYDAGGNLISQTYPDGIVAAYATEETDDTVELRYSKNGTTWFTDSQASNIHGQWVGHYGLPSNQTYTYDGTGRLTQVGDRGANGYGSSSCTTRTYGFTGTAGTNGNRTSLTTYAPAGDGNCQTSTSSSTVNLTYDSADRLSNDPATRAAGISYDPFGRILNLPGALTTVSGTGGNAISQGYYSNDLVNTQTSNGITRTWNLDTTQQRFRTFTNSSTGLTKTNHYTGSGDSPSWIDEADGTQTLYTAGLDGNLAAQATRTIGSGVVAPVTFQLANLHGDIVTTASAGASLFDGTVNDNDEYGNTKLGSTNRYSWLGGKQRSTDTLGGLTLMGVRLYSPVIGRFLSRDPVAGASANAYDYPADPVNLVDTDGREPRIADERCTCTKRNRNFQKVSGSEYAVNQRWQNITAGNGKFRKGVNALLEWASWAGARTFARVKNIQAQVRIRYATFWRCDAGIRRYQFGRTGWGYRVRADVILGTPIMPFEKTVKYTSSWNNFSF